MQESNGQKQVAVSIMIPVYNRKDFISDCIRSALDQTYLDFEIVVIDNASDDGTWEICESIAAENNRVKVYRNATNVGPVLNWLRCLEVAKGNYGKFLFSDDLMMPTFISDTLKYFNDPSVAFVTTAAWMGENQKDAILCYSTTELDERISTKTYLDGLATQSRALPYSPGTAIFRMSDLRLNLLHKINSSRPHDFAKNGAGPDILLFALTVMQYDAVVMVSKPLVFLRVHKESLSVANENDSVSEGYRIALAWFFRRYVSLDHWASWIAKIWLYELMHRRSIRPPSFYAVMYEGCKNKNENMRVLKMALKIIYRRVIKKKNKLVL